MALTDDQLKAQGLYAPPPDISASLPAGMPPILPPAQTQYLRSILGDKIPQGAQIPTSHEQGKEEYQQYMPQITSQPGTADYFRQRQEQLEYKQQHPWGDEISAHPGALGKIGHVASTIGNIAGDIFAPSTMALIPGTQLHNERLEQQNERGIGQGEENAVKEAQAQNLEDQPEVREAKLELQQEKQQETQEKDANANQVALRRLGLKTGPDGKIAPIEYSEMSPNEQALHDLKTMQAEAAEARAAMDKAKNDPNSPAFKLAQQRLLVASQNAANAYRRLGLSEEQFQNKLQEQELLKPSGQAQSRGSAAQAAINVMPELENQLKDPENAKKLGAVMGRIQRGEIAIGSVDPKIQQLYSAMQSFYAMQPAVHGFRNAEFVKDFNSFVGGLQTDPQSTLAGLQGLKPTLNSVAKEGKTYHKRIVEGRDNTPAGNGKPGTKEDPLGIR